MKILMLFISLLLFTGCSTLTNLADNHESKVRVAVMVAIQGSTEDRTKWQENAIRVSNEANNFERQLIDLDTFTVTDLRIKLQQRIIELGMTPAATLFFQELIPVIEEQIAVDIDTGLISADSKVTLQKYLNIARNAARAYL